MFMKIPEVISMFPFIMYCAGETQRVLLAPPFTSSNGSKNLNLLIFYFLYVSVFQGHEWGHPAQIQLYLK